MKLPALERQPRNSIAQRHMSVNQSSHTVVNEDLPTSKTLVAPDNGIKQQYSGIMYTSPRDVLNPPAKANSIRFKSPMNKFYATGDDQHFSPVLSASMKPLGGSN